jgi:hypothetical protein
MDKLEGLLRDGINNVRSNPISYYKNLENGLRKMNRSEITLCDSRCKINNVKYAIELLEELKNTPRLNTLTKSNELKLVSDYFLKNSLLEEDIITYLNNVTSNKLVDEVIKYCTPYGIVGISYDISKGESDSILFRLLLDENSNIRANRNLLLCKDVNFIGISCSYIDDTDQVLTILVYCQEFIIDTPNNFNTYTHNISTPRGNESKLLSNQSPIVHLVECDDKSPFDKDIVGCDELINHIYHSERIVDNIRVEKKTIKDKFNRNIIYVIKKILYTNGDFEEIANKI